MLSPRLAVVGSCVFDLSFRVQQFPDQGDLVYASDVSMGCGGKGSNQAVAAAAVGCDVTFVGAVGDDWMGRAFLPHLSEAGVRPELQSVAAQTSVAVPIADDSGCNTIVVHESAGLYLDPGFVSTALDAHPADFVVTQLETPADVLSMLAGRRARGDFALVVNLAPARERGRDVADHADVVIVNEVEARFAEEFLSPSRCPVIVTTLGAEGARVRLRTGTVLVPAFEAEVVDSTGAGDAFTAAFCRWYALTGDAVLATRAGVAAGSIACGALGAASSRPAIEAIEAYLAG